MQHISQALARAVRIAPANDEGRGSPQSAAPDFQQAQPDYPTNQPDGKVLNLLRLRATLSGVNVYPMSDGSYVVSSAGGCQRLPDRRSAAIYLRRVGGAI